ncbi:MAG: biopolymer transporter ExbD [Opitutaceae bacterium]|jgi:biopolymer transport protein ExbD
MARTFRQRRQMHAVSELNVTNLLDLAFVLLIIFMIATPLITSEQTIPINLPSESKSNQAKPDPDVTFQQISIDRQGAYFFGSERVTLSALQARLRKLGAEQKPPVIKIRADLALQWQQVVTLMDELKKAELTKISFDTQAPD